MDSFDAEPHHVISEVFLINDEYLSKVTIILLPYLLV